MGRQSTVQLADLASAEATEQLVVDCWNWRQRVDIWVNNAGADVLTTPAADWPFEAKLQRLWEVDVLGTIRLSRQIGQRMLSRGGVILNIGWDQAETGMAGESGQMFATAKGAIMAFTRSLARSLAPSVRVNCLAPGWIRTAWGQRASDPWQQRATVKPCFSAGEHRKTWPRPHASWSRQTPPSSPDRLWPSTEAWPGPPRPAATIPLYPPRDRPESFMAEHYQFVTGRLAEHSLRRVVDPLARQAGFEYTIDVLPITVAALMTPRWVARHLGHVPAATRIMLPGYCDQNLTDLTQQTNLPVELGPRDLHALPEFFGQAAAAEEYGSYQIEILAEINHAPRLTLDEIRRQAHGLAEDGADVIDLGCEPGEVWSGVADGVKALRDEGRRVSIDSFNVKEIAAAARAGAELVLSVNQSNRHAAGDWGCEVVAIPDDLPTLGGLDETLQWLDRQQVPYRIDPVLEPIGFGFASSLQRYFQLRQARPQARMLMGIGNLTELTDVDSAAINLLLLGLCEELQIGSVLTTQVINWSRSSVRECDLARRLVHHAVRHRRLPKHLEPRLVLLRDARLYPFGEAGLRQLAQQIKDSNYRIFAEQDQLHLIGAGLHLRDRDPFLLFEKLLATHPDKLNLSHAFYLGYELSKAVTALTLGKQYRQDEALDWGFLTVTERSHRARRTGP